MIFHKEVITIKKINTSIKMIIAVIFPTIIIFYLMPLLENNGGKVSLFLGMIVNYLTIYLEFRLIQEIQDSINEK